MYLSPLKLVFIGKPMSTITYNDNGEQRTVPLWATESQMERLIAGLDIKDNGKQQKTTEKLVEEIKNLNDAVNTAGGDFKKGVEDLDSSIDEIIDDMANVGFSFERALGKVAKGGKILDKLIGGLLLVAGTLAGAVQAKLMQTAQSLASLSQVGQALEGQTVMNIAALNQLGMSSEQAVKAMINNAQIMRVMGADVVPEVIGSFLEISNQGQDLGLSLKQATDLALAELSMRTSLMNLGALDQQQRKVAIKRIAEVNANQLEYSKVLGVSTDVLRDFADQVLQNNQMLMSQLITVPNATRAELTAGLTDFVSGLRAMGGEAGGEIAAAVTEAASMGAIGFSEAAFGFISVLPQLSDNFQDVIQQFNDGMIDGKQAALDIASELGNLGQAEKDRVFLLARAGDEQAKMMAKGIIQFEQSQQKMKKQGVEIDKVQRGFQTLNMVVEKVKGMFSAAFNNFIQGFSDGIPEVEEFVNGIGTALQPIMRALANMGVSVDSTNKTFKGAGKSVAENLTENISNFANWIAGKIAWLDGYFDGLKADTFGGKVKEVLGDIGMAMVDGIKNLIPWGKIALAVTAGLIVAGGIKGVGQGLGQVGAGLVGGGLNTVGGGVGLGSAKMGKGIGMGLKSAAGGLSALANPAVLIGLAAITAAIIGIGFALKLAAPGIKAFGTVITAVFEGIAGVVMAIGDSIANMMEKFGASRVAKINAKSEAALKSTRATTAAIKELDGSVDAEGLMAMGNSIDFLGNALGNFAGKMSPTILSSMRSGIAGFLGNDSPMQQVMAMSEQADPVKIMDLAKATMASNAANAGATELSQSLADGRDSVTNYNTTNNTSSSSTTGSDNKALAELIEAQTNLQLTSLEEIKKSNRLLSEISNKTA
jgi:hypothetical protein